MRLAFTIFFFLMGLSAVLAQRTSEAEIAKEAVFISANQKKLLGKYDEAAELYLKLLQEDPVNSAIWHDLARVYLAQGQNEEAVKAAQKAVRYDPQNTWILLTLAQIQLDSDSYASAAATFSQLAQKIGNQDLYQRWTDALVAGGSYKEAISSLDIADDRFGINEQRSDQRVELYLKLKDTKNAIAELRTWVDMYPQESHYLLKLGKFYTLINDDNKAIRTFEQVLTIEANNGEAILALQDLNSDRIKSSDDMLTAMVHSPDVAIDMKIKALLPALTAGTEEEVRAILPLTEYLAVQHPQHPQSQAVHADVLYLLGDLPQATTYYTRTLELHKGNYQVWDQLMTIYDQLGQYQELHQVSSKAMDYFPNQGGPYYYMAKVALHDDDTDMAADMIAEAQMVGGSNAQMQQRLSILSAHLLDRAGRTQEALTTLQAISDKDADSMELIGDLYIKIGDKPKAIKAFREALSLGGDQDRLKLKLESI